MVVNLELLQREIDWALIDSYFFFSLFSEPLTNHKDVLLG